MSKTVISIGVVLSIVVLAVFWFNQKPEPIEPPVEEETEVIEIPETVFDSNVIIPGTTARFFFPHKGFYGHGITLPTMSHSENGMFTFRLAPIAQFVEEQASEYITLNFTVQGRMNEQMEDHEEMQLEKADKATSSEAMMAMESDHEALMEHDSMMIEDQGAMMATATPLTLEEVPAVKNYPEGEYLQIEDKQYYLYKTVGEQTTWTAVIMVEEKPMIVEMSYAEGDSDISKAVYMHNDALFLEILANIWLAM